MPAAGSPGDPGVQRLGAVLAALPSVFSCIPKDYQNKAQLQDKGQIKGMAVIVFADIA